MASPRIAIVGAGIGGLTLAIELRRRGLEPEVYEQTAELREVGAAVALSANATRFLRDRLGVGDALAARSADVDGLVFRDGRSGEVVGRLLSRAEYHRRCGAPYFGVHRADLQQVLADALGGAGLHLGRQLVSIVDSGPAALLHFADGGSAEADLVIGADGARSTLRTHVVGYDDARFSGSYGWRGIVPADRLDLLPDPDAIQFWMGPNGHLLHYPIGKAPAGAAAHNFLLVRRLEGPWAEPAWLGSGTPDEHLAAFADWHPAVLQMIGAVPGGDRWGLFHRPPLHAWSRGRVTLLGDAAHALVPHHGQGANQSIEDAIVLADCLLGEHDWDLARRHYQERRLARTRRVQIASATTADVLHLPDGPRAEARNARLGSAEAWDRHLAWIHEFEAAPQHAR